MKEIRTSYEQKRRCGYRKPGGIYMVSDDPGMPCCKLPHPLTVCPTCNCGIKPSRAWTWVDGDALFSGTKCSNDFFSAAFLCPLSKPSIGRSGLLWIGEKFYSPDEFREEADRMGISRRIPRVPRGFVPNETWVLLAHRKIDMGGEEPVPAIFRVFRPRLEYVVKGHETVEELKDLIKRGIEPVRVVPVGG